MRRNTVFGAVDPEGKAEPKWKVQANFTGQLDIHDIVALKLGATGVLRLLRSV